MRTPTDAALLNRAKTLIEHMSQRARWVYALPTSAGVELAKRPLGEHGFRGPEARPLGSSWTHPSATLDLELHEALDVAILSASGLDAVAALAQLLDEGGFYAQTTLLRSAHEVGSEDARKALATVCRMVVVWDDPWAELFRAHLTSDLEIDRANALECLQIAASVSGDRRGVLALLEEAGSVEGTPELQARLQAAMAAVAQTAGR